MDSPLCSNKKRTLDELSGTNVNASGEVQSMKTEIEQLKVEIDALKEDKISMGEEIEKLKASLSEATNGDENSDEEEESDDESVCDGSPFSKNCILLKQYKQENGNCKVPRSIALGVWVHNTRNNYKKKKLTQDKVDKLNKIGFYWGKGHPEPATWEDRFEELENYQATFGHCNVPVSPDPALMSDLAKWVVEQRKQGRRLRKQRPSDMTMDQYRTLTEMKFVWKPKTKKRSSA